MAAKAPTSVTAAFWEAVFSCLVVFHGQTVGDARRALERLQKRVYKSPDPDLILHDEPFYVASDLVKSNLRLEGEVVEAYNQILHEAGLSASRG